MKSRLASLTLGVVLATCALAGCTPAPEPTEPSPVFTSEADAFAAAEETYRAYIDALNRVDLSDPETFEDVYAWTTGDANADARSTFSQMHGDGWVVQGQSVPRVVVPQVATGEGLTEIQVAVCLDVTTVELLDADGNSVVDATRPDVQTMLVSMTEMPTTSTGLAIADFEGREGEPSCE